MILVDAFIVKEIFASAVFASILLVAFGVLSLQEARDAINWALYVTVGSAIGVGTALINSGIASSTANFIVRIGDSIGFGMAGLFGCIYFITVILSYLVSSNVAVALVFPIVKEAASQSGADVVMLSHCVIFASSSCYMTPFSHTANSMIFGLGGQFSRRTCVVILNVHCPDFFAPIIILFCARLQKDRLYTVWLPIAIHPMDRYCRSSKCQSGLVLELDYFGRMLHRLSTLHNSRRPMSQKKRKQRKLIAASCTVLVCFYDAHRSFNLWDLATPLVKSTNMMHKSTVCLVHLYNLCCLSSAPTSCVTTLYDRVSNTIEKGRCNTTQIIQDSKKIFGLKRN